MKEAQTNILLKVVNNIYVVINNENAIYKLSNVEVSQWKKHESLYWSSEHNANVNNFKAEMLKL